MGFHPRWDDTVQMWKSKGDEISHVYSALRILVVGLPMAVAADKPVVTCIGFNSLWCLRDGTKIRIFLLCTVTARKIKATPTRISSVIIHAADRDTEPRRGLLGTTRFAGRESRQGCQTSPGRARTQTSFAEKRHGARGCSIGVCCEQLALLVHGNRWISKLDLRLGDWNEKSNTPG